MSSSAGQLEQYLASNSWATFSDLVSTGFCGTHDHDAAMSIIRTLRSLKCTQDVREKLSRQPHCDCAFGLPDGREAEILIDELNAVVEAGLEFLRERLSQQGSDAVHLFSDRADGSGLSAAEMQSLVNTLKEFPADNAGPAERRRPTRRRHAALHPDDLREIEDEIDRLGSI
jgi:hypothetical protein